MWLIGYVLRIITVFFKFFKASIWFIGKTMGKCMSLFCQPKKKKKYDQHDLESNKRGARHRSPQRLQSSKKQTQSTTTDHVDLEFNKPDTRYSSPQKQQPTKKEIKPTPSNYSNSQHSGKYNSDVDTVQHGQTTDDQPNLESNKREAKHRSPQTPQSPEKQTQPNTNSSKHSSSQHSGKDISDKEMAQFAQSLGYHKVNSVKNQSLSSRDYTCPIHFNKKIERNVPQIQNTYEPNHMKFPRSSNSGPSTSTSSKSKKTHKENSSYTNIQQGLRRIPVTSNSVSPHRLNVDTSKYQNTSARSSEDLPKPIIIECKDIDGNTVNKIPLTTSQEKSPNLQSDNNLYPHTDRATRKSTIGDLLETSFADTIETRRSGVTLRSYQSQSGESIEINNNFSKDSNMNFTSDQTENLLNQSVKIDHDQHNISFENLSNTNDALSKSDSVNATLLITNNTEYIASSKPVIQINKNYVDNKQLKAPVTKDSNETTEYEPTTCIKLHAIDNKQSYGDIRQVSSSYIYYSSPNIDEKPTDNSFNDTPAGENAMMAKTSFVTQYKPPAKETCLSLETTTNKNQRNTDSTNDLDKGINRSNLTNSEYSKSKKSSSFSSVTGKKYTTPEKTESLHESFHDEENVSFYQPPGVSTIQSNNKNISSDTNLQELNCSLLSNTHSETVTVSAQRQDTDFEIKSRTNRHVKTDSGLKQEVVNRFKNSHCYPNITPQPKILLNDENGSDLLENQQRIDFVTSNDTKIIDTIETYVRNSLNSTELSIQDILRRVNEINNLYTESDTLKQKTNEIQIKGGSLLQQESDKDPLKLPYCIPNEQEVITDNQEKSKERLDCEIGNDNKKILSYSLDTNRNSGEVPEVDGNSEDTFETPMNSNSDKSEIHHDENELFLNHESATSNKTGENNSVSTIPYPHQQQDENKSKVSTENFSNNNSEEYSKTNVITKNNASNSVQDRGQKVSIEKRSNSRSNESIEKRGGSKLTVTTSQEIDTLVHEDKGIFPTDLDEQDETDNQEEYINHKSELDTEIENTLQEERKYMSKEKTNEENIDKKTAILELMKNNNCSQSHDQSNEQNNLESTSSNMSSLESSKQISKNSETLLRTGLNDISECDNGESKLRETTNVAAENSSVDTLQGLLQQESDKDPLKVSCCIPNEQEVITDNQENSKERLDCEIGNDNKEILSYSLDTYRNSGEVPEVDGNSEDTFETKMNINFDKSETHHDENKLFLDHESATSKKTGENNSISPLPYPHQQQDEDKSKVSTENFCNNNSEEYSKTNVITKNNATNSVQDRGQKVSIVKRSNSRNNESIEKRGGSKLTVTISQEKDTLVHGDKGIISTDSNEQDETDNQEEYINYESELDTEIENRNNESIEKRGLNNNNCSQSYDQSNEQNNLVSTSSNISSLESCKQISKNSETSLRTGLNEISECDNGESKLRETTKAAAESSPVDTLQDQYQPQNENMRNFADENIDNKPNVKKYRKSNNTIENIANESFKIPHSVFSTVSDDNKSNVKQQDILSLSNRNENDNVNIEEKNKDILDQETKKFTDTTTCTQSYNQSQQNDDFNSFFRNKENIENKQLQDIESKEKVVKQMKLDHTDNLEIDNLKLEELPKNKKDYEETHTQTIPIDSSSSDKIGKSYVGRDINGPLEENTNNYETKLLKDNLVASTQNINNQQVIQEVIEKDISGASHLEQNTMVDDIDPKIYESVTKLLETIQEKAMPFEDEIKNFTELEDSNKYYYIEESLRRLIDKLDDMFDDIGENRVLREKRKTVYKYIFPLFDRLDEKVIENKERIEREKRNR